MLIPCQPNIVGTARNAGDASRSIAPRSASTSATDVHVQIRNAFRRNGTTLKEWAEARGFNPTLVYAVFEGKRKCLRGESHRITVALGIKTST